MSTSKRLFRNFVFLFASNLLGQLFMLGGLAYLARILGPAAFGAWALAQAMMLYSLRANEMGLEPVGIRAVARTPNRLWQLVSTITGIRIGLSFLIYGAMALGVVAGFFPSGSGTLILIFGLAVFPASVVLEWVFEGHQSVGVVCIARIIKGALFGCLVTVFVQQASHANAAAFYYVISIALPAVFVILATVRRFKPVNLAFAWSEARQLLSEALPIGVATILFQYTLFIGTIMIGYLSANESVGYYSAGHRLIIFVWAYGVVTSNRVVLPQLSIVFQISKEDFGEFILRYLRILALISLPFAIAAIGGGADLIRIVFGPQYQQSVEVFQILSLALVIAAIRSILEVGLIASNRQKLFMRGMVGLALLYTILTYAFFELWGIKGVAWAAVLSEAAFCLYLASVFSYVSFGRMFKPVWKPVLATGAVLGLLFLSGLKSVLLTVPLGIGLYVCALVILGELTKKDLSDIRHLITADVRPEAQVENRS